jgi:predicted ABC-type ATPase
MLARIQELMEEGESFAFETTLATRSYKGFVQKAQAKGFKVTLLFLSLKSIELAQQRVN